MKKGGRFQYLKEQGEMNAPVVRPAGGKKKPKKPAFLLPKGRKKG